ncbi:50S ribosomal protein L24 [Patescibacteria group bacterium]|nr:50S ribosomal protein L24 [Patescibacteria group bacterium]
MKKMRIKKNDHVLVIAGKNRGKKGKVLEVLPEKNRIVVDKVNKSFRNVRPKKEGEKGQRIEYFAPLHVSNVMIIDPKSNKQTRIGIKKLENGEKVRVSKKTGENLDK